jgi:Flp pilus assembly protein TadD/predicted Zn-dependent protease with MMP-like domain
MSSSLRRAAVLILAAACSRSSSSAASAIRQGGTPGPEPSRPAATRLTPAPALRPIRPRPAPCLPDDPSAGARALAEEARQALDSGRNDRALDCSEEAIRLDPRLVSALAARAGALTALERSDEARLAYARALDVDPDDPVALLGAARFHVDRLNGERDALETGLAYALRGAAAALRPPRRDRELAAELRLVAGIAENDLGRNRTALVHLNKALAAIPDDPDVIYERGVALFELCRFDEARRAFQRALALAPDDPWTIHQLGLLAERSGDLRRAEELLSRARKIDPKDFGPELPVDEPAFRAEVERIVAALSAEDRRVLAAVPIEIQDLPDATDLVAVDPPLSPAILGLFRGPSQDEPCEAEDGPRCRSIVLYRKNLIRFVHGREELSAQVRVTLLHELGHLRGEDDDQLRDRGLE